MRATFFVLGILACSSVFAQNFERPFLDNDPERVGDVKIISTNMEVVGDEIYKSFEVECLQDGSYFLDAWICIPVIKGKYAEYKIAVNGNLQESTLKPQEASWQSLALTDTKRSAATLKLKKGINKVSVIGDAPMVPAVEFIKLSLNPAKAGISDKAYREFFEKVQSNRLDEVVPQSGVQSAPIGDDQDIVHPLRGMYGQIYDYSIYVIQITIGRKSSSQKISI